MSPSHDQSSSPQEQGRRRRGRPRRRRCLLKGCAQWFAPTRPQARYCSDGCRHEAARWRQWKAQQHYRQTDQGRRPAGGRRAAGGGPGDPRRPRGRPSDQSATTSRGSSPNDKSAADHQASCRCDRLCLGVRGRVQPPGRGRIRDVPSTAGRDAPANASYLASRKLVAYLNVDSAASGPAFQGSAVGSLAPLLVEVSRSLDDPAGTSLYEAWKKSAAADTARFAATGGGERKAAVDDDSLVDTRIGSGSDHTVFLNAIGRPVVGLTFDGPYGVYHSMYDDDDWVNHFGDPGCRYHTLMSQLWGVLALRLANADALPFDFGFYGRDIRTFLNELCAAGGQAPSAAGRTTEGCRAGDVDLGPAIATAEEFAGAGRELKQAVEAAFAAGPLDEKKTVALNRRIMDVESNWLSAEGIPGRPWFKLLYAARDTYAHLELPGITEAVERQGWKTAGEQTGRLMGALGRNTAFLREALADLKRR